MSKIKSFFWDQLQEEPSYPFNEYYFELDRIIKDKPMLKSKMSLIEPAFLELMGKVLAFGEEKYGAYNYRNTVTVTEHVDSLMRHLVAFMQRNDLDDESGLHHLGHMATRIMFIYFSVLNHTNLDNRPPKLDEDLPF